MAHADDPPPTAEGAPLKGAAGQRVADPATRFFDVALDLLSVASVETGRFVRVGSGFTRLLGWTADELVGAPFLDLVHPEDLEDSLAAVASLAAGEDLVEFENRALCKDGTARWIDWQVATDPEAGLIYAAGRDVTQRHRREANAATVTALAADLARVSTERAVLDAVGARLGDHLDAVAVFVAGIDLGGEVAAVQAARGAAPRDLEGFAPLLREDADGLQTGCPVVVGEPRGGSLYEAGALAGRAFVAAPCFQDGTLRHLLIVAAAAPRDWRADEVALVEEVAARALPRLERARAEAEVRALNRALEGRVAERAAAVRRLSQALVLAEQAERERIARVLHDDLQQVLFAALIKLQVGDGEGAEALLGQATALTRSLSHELAPPALRGGTLADLLNGLAENTRELHGLEVEVEVESGAEVRGEHVRAVLYGALSELLFNVAKHAGAERVRILAQRVRASEAAPLVRIAVEDDGVGFDPAEHGGDFGGTGLPGVRERLRLVGGRLDVESTPGGGTRATTEVPAGA